MSEDQIILINKPYDWTSFDVVKYVRKALMNNRPSTIGPRSLMKVGHAGTLDPLATGLLVLCTGAMTKRITEIQQLEKEYSGSFILGATTSSYDRETEITNRKNTSHLTKEIIEQTAKKFTGEVLQTPPPHSAAKINGRRAYAMARNGEAVDLASKKVTIHKFEITGIVTSEDNAVSSLTSAGEIEVFFSITCSKGTYIRSIAYDFGEALGCGAFLSSLCRERIGHYNLKDAVEPKFFQKESVIT